MNSGPGLKAETATVELVTVANQDGVPLDGVLWGCEDARAAVLHLHAKGGNFYTGPGRFIPSFSRSAPLAHLSLNMRCHDLGTTRADLPCGDMFSVSDAFGRGGFVDGGMWEHIALGWHDVAAGVTLLRGRGFDRIFLAGHSSGGFYVGQASAHELGICGRILLSPLTASATSLPTWFGDRLEDVVEHARELVSAGRGRQLIPVPHWYYGISAQSLVERAAEPAGVWLDALRQSSAPVLLVYGSQESRGDLWRSLIGQLGQEDVRIVEIPDAEHHYVGHEQEVTDAVVDWVLERAPDRRPAPSS